VLEFRDAVDGDLPALLALYAQLEQEPDVSMDLAAARALWERIRDRPDYRIVVAESPSDGIVGAYSLQIVQGLAHAGTPSAIVEDVVVDSRYRRRGIGRKMMENAIAHARVQGCYKLALSSNRRREAAHRFYEALGFERHGYSFAVFLKRD